jgi:hypothetical protein
MLIAEFIDGAIIGTWFDDHGITDSPPADFGFLIEGLGFILVLGGGARLDMGARSLPGAHQMVPMTSKGVALSPGAVSTT